MITPAEIAKVTMTEEKKKTAKNDYFAFYVGRPLSYVLTIPFLYTDISPNAVSVLSVLPLVAGTILAYTSETLVGQIIVWLLFFLWNLLDGVDGNIARFKKQFSPMGSVYDAMSGYFAMVLTFFAAGLMAFKTGGILDTLAINEELWIILGALSGVSVIFPRLVMHKAISTLKSEESFSDVKDKSSFDLIKIIALNLSSITGGAQVLLLIAVLFGMTDLYTLLYFIFNIMVMIVSLAKILKEK